MSGRRVLITGATSGLGREMARQLGAEGCRLALTGRRAELLAEVARAAREAGAADVLELPGDVATPEDVRRHYGQIKSRLAGLDWAILNAGVGDSNDAHAFSAQVYRWTFSINVLGVANWLEAVLPDMIAARSGTVAAISSLAAFRGLPGSGAYCASKAAVNVMMEAARVELRGSGVRVVTVCPGFVKSELTARNDPGQMIFLLETEDGVRRILAGVRQGRALVHFPWQLSWPMIYLAANLPNALYDFILSRLKRRKAPARDSPRTIR